MKADTFAQRCIVFLLKSSLHSLLRSASYHGTLFSHSKDDERLLTLTGKERVGGSTAAKIDTHWINAPLCPTYPTFSISGGLWRMGVALAGQLAQL